MFSPIATEEGVPRHPGTAQAGRAALGHFVPRRRRPSAGPLSSNRQLLEGKSSNADPSSFERLNYIPRGYEPSEIVVAPTAERVEVALDVPKKK
ncbi:MAG: hypothetical protein WD851_02135 [Pirellulales bacterium]